MKIGKLKKGTRFTFNGSDFKIMKSGFGTGKYVDVEFEKIASKDQSTYTLPKYTEVQIKQK